MKTHNAVQTNHINAKNCHQRAAKLERTLEKSKVPKIEVKQFPRLDTADMKNIHMTISMWADV